MLFFSSVQSRDAVNSEWSSLFWIDILLPWLAGMGMTILVLKKNGRDLKREIWNDMCCISTPPRVIPLAHSPRTEETQELESIGSEKSCKQSIRITEPHIKLETKYPDEALNTDNPGLQGSNIKPDLKNIKKKIRTEPGKAHHTE